MFPHFQEWAHLMVKCSNNDSGIVAYPIVQCPNIHSGMGSPDD